MKILVADDNARMRRMVRQALAGLTSEVYEAGDGVEAVAVCAALRPDWVLMDLRMKPMDGLRATAEIKARFPGTRVAIVTQYDEAEMRAEATRAGACAYVLKEDLQELPAIVSGRHAPGACTEGGAPPRPDRSKAHGPEHPKSKN